MQPFYCREEAIRTPDPHVPNVVRYQLRYFSLFFDKGTAFFFFCQIFLGIYIPVDTYMSYLERGRKLIAAQCCWIKLLMLLIQIIHVVLSSVNSCYLFYNPNKGRILFFLKDLYTTWHLPETPWAKRKGHIKSHHVYCSRYFYRNTIFSPPYARARAYIYYIRTRIPHNLSLITHSS